MPAPWHCVLSDFTLDGANTAGLIGIRYRAGYEFGANGGKLNTFQRLSLFDMHVGIEVGGPLLPDLVGSSFRNLDISGERTHTARPDVTCLRACEWHSLIYFF
jgi:hypothetical protein